MSTYREELCNKDERGIPVFSPLCQPGRTVDTTLTKQVRSTYGDMDCYIPPVQYPKPQPGQFTDSASANNWFSDPTYAQHVALRTLGKDEDTIITSESLKLYHKQKAMEKVAASLFQTL